MKNCRNRDKVDTSNTYRMIAQFPGLAQALL